MVLAEVAEQMASRGGHLDQWESVTALPAFNPDLDPMEAAEGLLPDAVSELRERAANAAGLVVASPEYARGYPGALKNSLDWLVGSQAVFGRPAAVITASPGFKGGATAADGLAAVLRMMSACPVHVLSVGQVTLKTTDGRVSDSETIAKIGSLVERLLEPRCEQ
jgi:NAD(P)H-dependent FMN reductase